MKTDPHANMRFCRRPTSAGCFSKCRLVFGKRADLFALLEQEDELAEQFIKAFLHAIDRAVIPVKQEEVQHMAPYSIQAYAILKNRFEEEEMMTALQDHSNGFDF